ncbi:MAG: OmpH family outer membrane protein [Crocinitomicaceae bacterium]|jgi:Skp family chaperone for outer membrane proteins|nr:OmpH family outer membrane protein [Crocinitomicaceae bacterium]MDG2505182.1 OmpH family outer membrane protein [Crocinitomicaceae bacterium]
MKISLYFICLCFCFSCANDPVEEKKVTSPTQVNVLEKDTAGLVIAFYFNDSLKEGFTYYKDIDEKVSRKNLSYQNELQSKTQALENFVAKKGAEANQGLLSQNEIAKIQEKAQRMEAELVQYQQREGARLEAEVMRELTAINNKVKSFGRKFSEANGIDLLLGYADGGQINYVNPSMDVTRSFIEFLNNEQKAIEADL